MTVIHPEAFARRISDEGIKVYPVAVRQVPILTAEEYADRAVRELAAREVAERLGIAGVPREYQAVMLRRPSVPSRVKKGRLKHKLGLFGIALGTLLGILLIGYGLGWVVEYFQS